MDSCKIVLIDDEPGVLLALKLLLEAIGHSVTTFNVPTEAVDFIRSRLDSPVDLILCDLRMPELTGFGVLEELAHMQCDTPFVLISGHATSEERDKAFALGASSFLSKPFTPEQVREVIQSVQSRRDKRKTA